jgi:hypothetical protein
MSEIATSWSIARSTSYSDRRKLAAEQAGMLLMKA